MDSQPPLISISFPYPITSFDGGTNSNAASPSSGSRSGNPSQQQQQQSSTSSGPASAGSNASNSLPHVLSKVNERVRRLCDEVGAQYGCHITFSTPSDGATNRRHGPSEVCLSVNVLGPLNGALDARGALLKRIPTQTMITIKATRRILLNDNDEMKPLVKRKLDALMQSTQTQITCVGQNFEAVQQSQSQQSGPPPGLNSTPSNNNLAGTSPVGTSQFNNGGGNSSAAVGPGTMNAPSTQSMDIEIVGRWEKVELARMQCLVLLDEMAGLHCEPVEVDPKLHPLLAGRKRCILETVMHDTLTNIYLPSPFVAEAGSVENIGPLANKYSWTIWITGQAAGVAQAKERLVHMAAQRASMVMTKHINCLPRKLDWMLVNRKDQLRKMMQDNATHISVPVLGSGGTSLAVTGDDRVYLERTCRALMHMVCEFYVAGLQLANPPITGPTVAAAAKAPGVAQFLGALGRIAQSSRAEIVLQKHYFEIYGVEAAVKQAYTLVAELDNVKSLIRDTKIQLELALEHRDFINGKKNGKINKIIKQSGCKITFQENHNEYNMLIDLFNGFPVKAIEGLTLLEDELPAETSFYVPEAFHKRIIGVAGKNIQRIMKKYAVYVKFSNAEEFAQLGGYFENMDNVIARTPAKNHANLGLLKESIMELTTLGEKQQVTMAVSIPRQLHRLVVGPRACYLQDIVKVAKVDVEFPEKESGTDDVIVTGPEPQVQIARQRLQDLAPHLHELSVPGSPAAFYAIRSPEIQGLIGRLSHELGIDLYVYMPAPEEGPADCSFMFYYHRNNSGALEQAKALALEYLAAKQVPVHRQPGMPRSGSYANLQPQRSYDSFQHFPSKLLASVTTAGGGAEASAPAMAYAGFFPEGLARIVASGGVNPGEGGSSSGGGMTNSKFAHSSPNLRQLFEDISYQPPNPGSPGMSGRGSPDTHIKRSRSDVHDEMLQSSNLLAATLAATSLSSASYNPSHALPPHLQHLQQQQQQQHQQQQQQAAPPMQDRWAAAGASGSYTRRPDFRPIPIDTGNDLEDPSQDAELLKGFAGMLSPIDAPERAEPPLRVPSDKFCGLKLSRSMGVLDEKTKKREAMARGPSNLGGEATGSSSSAATGGRSSDTDLEHPEFTPDLIAQLFEMELHNPKDFLQIQLLLESLDLDNYVSIFVEQEVDFPTLLLLQDSDLKEIGVKAFGSRKKILNAIRECKEVAPPKQLSPVGGHLQQQQQQQQQQHQQQHFSQQSQQHPFSMQQQHPLHQQHPQSSHHHHHPQFLQQQQQQHQHHQQHDQHQQQSQQAQNPTQSRHTPQPAVVRRPDSSNSPQHSARSSVTSAYAAVAAQGSPTLLPHHQPLHFSHPHHLPPHSSHPFPSSSSSPQHFQSQFHHRASPTQSPSPVGGGRLTPMAAGYGGPSDPSTSTPSSGTTAAGGGPAGGRSGFGKSRIFYFSL
ncbi:hypothetical protein DFS34DRAFT_133003 [Phlyctochytrium arcticum]|nr:hypothetical protein DFS34DRAFT_133003 [Phlyctochytrium arcticum]